MTIQDMRAGIVANLGTISGLRTSVDIPDNPNPPQAVVGLQSVLYDQAFQNGLILYNFQVTVLIGRASDRWAQRLADTYTDVGSGGIKGAIESDPTLGGAAVDCRVSEMSNLGTVSLGEVIYLAADFTVQAYGTP